MTRVLTFTLIFPDRYGSGRRGRVYMPWVKGRQLRAYLRDPVLLSYGLIGLSLRCKMYNKHRQQVHLTYIPFLEDFVVLTPTKG